MANALRGKTAIITHPMCWEHKTAVTLERGRIDPPPENVHRLNVVCGEGIGSLRSKELQEFLEWHEQPQRAQFADVTRVHDYAYVRKIFDACMETSSDNSTIAHLDPDHVGLWWDPVALPAPEL